MNICGRAVLLGGLMIIAITAVIITGMALMDTASHDRASILRTIGNSCGSFAHDSPPLAAQLLVLIGHPRGLPAAFAPFL